MKKVAQIATVAGVFLASAPLAFAQTPAYTMDATVTASITDLLESYVASIFTLIPSGVLIVGGLSVTLFGIGFLWRWVRGKMHG